MNVKGDGIEIGLYGESEHPEASTDLQTPQGSDTNHRELAH